MVTVAAVFVDRDQVRRAFRSIQNMGVAGDSIGLAMADEDDLEEGLASAHESEKAERFFASLAGGAVGGTAGWVAGAGIAAAALAIPAFGPVIAAGTLAAAAAGTTVAGTLGWLTGGLLSSGVSLDEAQYYENRVRTGGILMTVQTDEERRNEVRSKLEAFGGQVAQTNGPGGVEGESEPRSEDVRSEDVVSPGADGRQHEARRSDTA